MFELGSLKAFVEVADSGSFSIAADNLFLTQPAISKRVAALEARLDTRLFDRIGRQVLLTETGQALLPRARRLLDDAEAISRIAATLSGEVRGVLTMGTSHHVGLHRLPPVLRRFTERYPDVRLDIRFMDSEEACRAVQGGELQLAVVTLPPTGQLEHLHLQRIWRDPLRFVANRGHALTRRRRVEPSALAAHPAVLPSRNTYTRVILEQAVGAQGLRLVVGMSTNYLETLKMLAAIGLGWTLLPETMLSGELAPLAVTGLHLERALGVVTHTERSLSTAAQAMLDTCRALGDDGGGEQPAGRPQP